VFPAAAGTSFNVEKWFWHVPDGVLMSSDRFRRVFGTAVMRIFPFVRYTIHTYNLHIIYIAVFFMSRGIFYFFGGALAA
jgi:hypothetical protein